ncbi:MAG: hypothetical protein HY805_10850 [Nitrospirae bacterium]|nr:hypothetical protein [Nitrospirota bacterium]
MKKISKDKRDIAKALLDSGKTYREIADALDISTGTLHNISKESPEKTKGFIKELRQRLSAKHYMLADYILGSINIINLNYASLKDKVIASAILLDKARLFEQENPLDSKLKPNLSEQGFEQPPCLEKNPLKINDVFVQGKHDLSEHLNCEMAEKSNKDKDLVENI